MPSEREALRLKDIVDNIDRIDRYVIGMDFVAFANDPRTVDAVERCLQRLTEAAIKIGPERMSIISPQTPAEAVRGLGNVLRHAYDEIELTTIWTTIASSLPALRRDCLAALAGDGSRKGDS